MRGVIPGRVLVELERLTGFATAGLFDLVAGTSTGGILACLAASGVTAREAMAFYYEAGPRIFSRPWYRALSSGLYLAGPSYSGKTLAEELRNCIGLAPIEQAQTRLMLPTVDADNVEARFLKSWDKELAGFPMWAAAAASASAQTYFPAFAYRHRGKDLRFIDGGNHTNNPAASALFEAERIWPGEPKMILHLGTGRQRNPKPLPDGGLATWAPLVFGTTSECQDDCARYYLEHWPAPLTAYTLDVALDRFPGMDDASKPTLDSLVTAIEQMLAAEKQTLEGICTALAL